MKVPEKYYDEIFDFEGSWGLPSKCGLKIVDHGNLKTIIVTELYQDNPGTSVTSAAGSLTEQICKAKGLEHNQIRYIECNPDTNSKLSFYDEEFFEVTFTEQDGKLTAPKYRKLSNAEVRNL